MSFRHKSDDPLSDGDGQRVSDSDVLNAMVSEDFCFSHCGDRNADSASLDLGLCNGDGLVSFSVWTEPDTGRCCCPLHFVDIGNEPPVID